MATLTRHDFKNYHSYKIDNRKVDGVTTILNNSLPKGALVGWAAGVVGAFMYDSPAEVATMAESLGRDAFVAACKQLPTSDRDKAARRGTEVHALAEQIANGLDPTVPDELAGHVEAYRDFRATHQPTNERTEVTVGHLAHLYAGTLDAWAHLPKLRGVTANYPTGPKVICDHDDRQCLSMVDIKTSRSGVFAETALQVAAYGYASHYLEGSELKPMPKIDHYLSLWLRADGWDLIPFDVTDADFRTFLYCQQVSAFTKRSKTIKGEAIHVG